MNLFSVLNEDDDESNLIKMVARRPRLISDIENPSERVQMAAISYENSSIRFIKHPTVKVQLAAVYREAEIIQLINNPDRATQIAAITRNPQMVISNERCLSKITDEVINACKKNIIKKTLKLMLEGSFLHITVEHILKGLASRKINWPELDVIRASLDYEQRRPDRYLG